MRNYQPEWRSVHKDADAPLIKLSREGVGALTGAAFRKEPPTLALKKRLDVSALKYHIKLYILQLFAHVREKLRRYLVRNIAYADIRVAALSDGI